MSVPVLRLSRCAALLLVALGSVALTLGACRAGAGRVLPPVPPRASLVFAEGAQRLASGDEAGARSSFEEAARLEPRWVAPLRALDDLDRAALLGPDVLARRRAEFEAAPSAESAYLVGRLEGGGGEERFERGIELDPDVAWNHHGLAWSLHTAGSSRAALRPGRRALAAARDTFEQTYFTVALARYEIALGRPERAADLLEERLGDVDVLSTDRATLTSWLAQAEMLSPVPAQAERGYRMGIEVLSTETLGDDDLVRLTAALLDAPLTLRGEQGPLEVAAALAEREGSARRTLRAHILLEADSPALALALLGDDPAGVRAFGRLQAARFARGQARQAVEAWCAALPRLVLDAALLPRDPRLAELVHAAREGTDGELAAALLAAGWFDEARAFAEGLALTDPEDALALEAHASAGVVLFRGIERVLQLVDRGQPYGGPFAQASTDGADASAPETPGVPRTIQSLDELLAALEPLFDTFHRAEGDPSERVDLRSSPRTSYGPAATVVHPGPFYSRSDAKSGLGRAGEPVAGLALELDRLLRFGIFGEAMGGGGPDGTLLRRVLVEERAGHHLGVPWHGLVAWCEGADVESRPGRRGARISGAALHEGYWIDLQAVREELAQWRRLESNFLKGDGQRAAAALAVRGTPRSAQGPDAELPPLLGEGERVRLAILVERAAARRDPEAELVTLDELALLTGLHEEGHLCDRSRFLPLGKNLLGAFDLLARGGFGPGGVSRELEERAELVALCEAPDPRLPLADILSAAELGSAVTPHAAAYRSLLTEWLETLEESARDTARYPQLDRTREYAQQLHRLAPEEVRAVALTLAHKKHLVRD